MSRKTVVVCDECGNATEESQGASVRVTFTDLQRQSKVADFCLDCADKLPGRSTGRRGRKTTKTSESPQ